MLILSSLRARLNARHCAKPLLQMIQLRPRRSPTVLILLQLLDIMLVSCPSLGDGDSEAQRGRWLAYVHQPTLPTMTLDCPPIVFS